MCPVVMNNLAKITNSGKLPHSPIYSSSESGVLVFPNLYDLKGKYISD